jgi:hypothetical protein
MKEKLGCVAAIVYVGIGFIQLLATIKGIQILFSMPWILAAFLSSIIAYIPVIGTIAGIKGATAAWGWRLWPAIAFFCWPYVLYIATVAIAGVADLLSWKKGGIS